MRRFSLTATGVDRPGIVANVAKVLFEHNCNIEDSSMTRLEDEFSIILIMSAPDNTDMDSLKKGLKAVEKGMGLAIHLKEIGKESAGRPRPSTHIIRVSGCDRPGIVYKTAALLSKSGINITDLTTKVVRGQGKDAYIMLMEVSYPQDIDAKSVETSLKALAETIGVTIEAGPIETYEAL